MSIDEAAQKIADVIAEAQDVGYLVDWDEGYGVLRVSRYGDGHRGFESRDIQIVGRRAEVIE